MIALFPGAAAIVAAAFCVRAGRRALTGRSPAMAAWSAALAQFAIAALCLALGVVLGWTPHLYRAYYALGAILNTIWLALGTLWLLAPKAVARVATAAVAVSSVLVLAFVLTSPLLPSAEAAFESERIPAASRVMSGAPRALSRVGSIGGSAVVLTGLLWSIVRARRRTAGLAMLSAGIVVVAAASEAARTGLVEAFSIGLLAGVVVMYAGFVKTTS